MIRWALLLTTCLLLPGCGTLGYYGHLASGQWQLMSARVPIAPLLHDPSTEPALAATLQEVLALRRFAVDQLDLPDSRSYTLYADLGRDAAVWNVLAAPRYALTAREFCSWLVGCLAYQGFFDRSRAEASAALLRDAGWDVQVAPVTAYSTLGWFADPVLNTMVRQGRLRLLSTVIHELAHERLFIKGDTAFNESYASFVEAEGWRQWQAYLGETPDHDDLLRMQRQRDFVRLVMEARTSLEAAYAEHAGDETALAAAKASGFQALRDQYVELRDDAWSGWPGYDAWFDRPLNNAHLLPFALYDQWVDAFAALFAQSGRDWPRFHAAAAALGALPEEAREAQLEALTAAAQRPQ